MEFKKIRLCAYIIAIPVFIIQLIRTMIFPSITYLDVGLLFSAGFLLLGLIWSEKENDN